jgi:acetyl-CoA synthetase
MILAVVDDDLRPVPSDTPGVLAVDRTRSPLFFFTGYWRAPTPSFQGDWYLTGDVMRQDADGYLYFIGRNDDIITSAGYRIGPADVENVLIEHPSVAEAAGIERTDKLAEELRSLVRRRLSAHAYPREIEFTASSPKTPSGKVQRFLLRQRA